MSFLEDINKAKREQATINSEIISEIVEHFKKELSNERFENNLKKRIIENIKDNKHETTIEVEFWDYHEGCPVTNFSISYCRMWSNGISNWESKYYKKVRLYDLRHDVTPLLAELLSNKLDELGVAYTFSRTDTNTRLDYPCYTFTIKN